MVCPCGGFVGLEDTTWASGGGGEGEGEDGGGACLAE